MKSTYEQHEFGQLIPKMLAKQFTELQESIASQGVRQPIILHDGKVLDGWNRYTAVNNLLDEGQEIPGTIKYEIFTGTDKEALELVLALNLGRRHITEEKRVKLALDIRKNLEKLKPEVSEKELDRQSAESAGTSARTVQRARQVEQKAPKEVREAMEAGEITPGTALKLAKVDKKDAAKAVKAAKAAGGRASKEVVKDSTVGVKDLKGRTVPKALKDVFEDADTLEQVHDALKSIMKQLGKVKDTYPACYTQAVMRNLESVSSVVKAEQAAWLCKQCDATGQADGKKCNVCKGRGWHPYGSGSEPKY